MFNCLNQTRFNSDDALMQVAFKVTEFLSISLSTKVCTKKFIISSNYKNIKILESNAVSPFIEAKIIKKLSYYAMYTEQSIYNLFQVIKKSLTGSGMNNFLAACYCFIVSPSTSILPPLYTIAIHLQSSFLYRNAKYDKFFKSHHKLYDYNNNHLLLYYNI